MASQSDRFKKAGKQNQLSALPADMQRAIAMGDTAALMTYIESRVNAMNIPPDSKKAFIEIFKLILLAGG